MRLPIELEEDAYAVLAILVEGPVTAGMVGDRWHTAPLKLAIRLFGSEGPVVTRANEPSMNAAFDRYQRTLRAIHHLESVGIVEISHDHQDPRLISRAWVPEA